MDNYVSGDTNNNNTVDALDRADGPEVSLVEAVYRGFLVRARRNYLGQWCGYITAPRAHPWARAACTGEDGAPVPPCENRLLWVIDVHGGCTYAEVEGDGDGDGDVTVGFDCCHMGTRPAVGRWAVMGRGVQRPRVCAGAAAEPRRASRAGSKRLKPSVLEAPPRAVRRVQRGGFFWSKVWGLRGYKTV
jgi:hypothetical protein